MASRGEIAFDEVVSVGRVEAAEGSVDRHW